MPKRNASKKAHTTGAKKHLGHRTVKSSSRIRAQRANQSDNVLPGKRPKRQASNVIDPDSEQEVFGVLLSERRRSRESKPTVPEKKTKSTQSNEPHKVPKTGIAKKRKRT